MTCIDYHPGSSILVPVGIDGLCAEHRRQRYDTKRCDDCGAPYEGQSGWHVPSFISYSDVSYYCPVCIDAAHQQYIYKNKRLEEIPIEQSLLLDWRRKYKRNCKGKRAIEAQLEALAKEKERCFAGSGFNPRANT